MFRSLSRSTVAVAFVLALILSTVPAQALPLDSGSPTLDTSWLDMALSWLGDLLGGGVGNDQEPLQSTTFSSSTSTGSVGPMSGSCIDPYGGTCHTGGGGGGV